MAYSAEDRDKIRRSYVFDGLSIEIAAAKWGIPIATVRRWKSEAKTKGDDWDRVKSATTLAGGSIDDLGRDILSGFLLQYQSTMVELQNSDILPQAKAQLLASLADSFNKTIAATKKILPETQPLAIAMEVMTLLADFICKDYPEHREAFVIILESFGTVLETKLGVK